MLDFREYAEGENFIVQYERVVKNLFIDKGCTSEMTDLWWSRLMSLKVPPTSLEELLEDF